MNGLRLVVAVAVLLPGLALADRPPPRVLLCDFAVEAGAPSPGLVEALARYEAARTDHAALLESGRTDPGRAARLLDEAARALE